MTKRLVVSLALLASVGAVAAPSASARLNPGFVITPATADFGKNPIGSTTVRKFHVRGRTCAEVDPTRPNCEEMIFPAIGFGPPFASRDFEVVRHTCGIFGVASATGDPCRMTVAFTPSKRGRRKGTLGRPWMGQVAALRGNGVKPRRKGSGGPPAGG